MKRGRARLSIPTWLIAEVVGVSEWTVRKHARAGEFDRGDLMSVYGYIMKHRRPDGKN